MIKMHNIFKDFVLSYTAYQYNWLLDDGSINKLFHNSINGMSIIVSGWFYPSPIQVVILIVALNNVETIITYIQINIKQDKASKSLKYMYINY